MSRQVFNVTSSLPDVSGLEKDPNSWLSYPFYPLYLLVGVALFGVVGNVLCFKTATLMPRNNFTVLIQHLAVWDSIYVVTSVVLVVFVKNFGTFLKSFHVSIKFFISI